MIPANDKISAKQLFAAGFMCQLSPIIRRVPAKTAEAAGGGAWLSVLLAAAPLAIAFFFVCLLVGSRGGRGLGAAFKDALGSVLGRILLAIYGLWFVFLAAFILRSGADRFIGTIYPGSGPVIFVVVMALACLPAAMGQLKALARSAMLFRPVLLVVMLVVFAFSLPDVRLAGMWQVTPSNELDVMYGSFSVFGPMSICIYLAFVTDQTEGKIKLSGLAGWLLAALAVAELMCLTTIGVFGAEMTARLRNPFFALVRDVTIFNAVERIDAIVVAMWVFSDFVLISLLLYTAAKNLRMSFGMEPREEKPKLTDLRRGRWLTPACVALAAAAGLVMAQDAVSLEKFTEVIVPLLNLLFAIVLPPAVFVIGRLRRKI